MRSLPVLLLLVACAGEPEDTATDLCADAAPVSWDSFGQAFLTETCQPCHASTAEERNGAPDDVVFDTEADVARLRERILLVATGPTAWMPPGGGVSEEDRNLLEVWLTCFPPES